MGKKKKKKKVKTTIFVSLEGKREELFFKVIENFANEAEKNINFNEDNESKISINFDEIKGGNSTNGVTDSSFCALTSTKLKVEIQHIDYAEEYQGHIIMIEFMYFLMRIFRLQMKFALDWVMFGVVV